MKKVLFYGDSNTYGYDPRGAFGGRYPREQRWTTILGEKLADEWEISQDGLPGRALPVTKREWDILRGYLVSELPFDLFAVMLGTNDLLSTLHPDAGETARRMNDLITLVEEIVGAADAANTANDGARETLARDRKMNDTQFRSAQILLIAPPKIQLTDASYAEPYVRGGKSYANIYYEEGQKLSRYYRELARYRGVLFADGASWDLDFAYDGVHLSEKGHAVFAQELERIFRAEL